MSLIKANAVQIGQSPTATQNFTLAVPSAPDGTIKLARGNSGATTQDVLSVDASGNVNSLVKSTGSTTARSLANRFADVVNVKDFGAVGDGVTDDTAAIQAAIDYAKTKTKKIFIPAGVYIISNTLNVTAAGNAGVIIEGVSSNNFNGTSGSVIKYTGTNSALKFSGTTVFTSCKNITFVGVNGNGAVGIDIDNAWFIDIDQCVFDSFNAVGAGAGIRFTYTGTGYFAGVTNIRNSFIENCYVGVHVIKTDINVINLDKNIFQNNTFGFCQGTGVANACSSRNVNFNNCEFEGNYDYDIFSYGGAQNWNIIGCYFERNDPTKNNPIINLSSSMASPINTAINIIGNTFSKQIAVAGQALVFITAADGVVFKNNWSAFGNQTDRYSIWIQNSTNYELWQTSVPSGDTPYPINENSTLRTTGSVYKTLGGIAIGGGIQFPQIQVPSTNSNTLDDYIERTWTPVLRGSTTAGSTSGTIYGNCIKIGKKVFLEFSFDAVTLTGASGILIISNLPYVSDNFTPYPSIPIAKFGVFEILSSPSSGTIIAYGTPGGQSVTFVSCNGSTSSYINVSQVKSNLTLYGQIEYTASN